MYVSPAGGVAEIRVKDPLKQMGGRRKQNSMIL